MEMEAAPVNPADLAALKERMKIIADADPKQYHNEFSLKRYLRAFKTVDAAFQVSNFLVGTGQCPPNTFITSSICFALSFCAQEHRTTDERLLDSGGPSSIEVVCCVHFPLASSSRRVWKFV